MSVESKSMTEPDSTHQLWHKYHPDIPNPCRYCGDVEVTGPLNEVVP